MWLREPATTAILEDASKHYPLESGGILMGYWVDAENVVATYSLGPGPNAGHHFGSFKPDHEWQVNQVARYYKQLERMETYLGDWHSHPSAQLAHLSYRDRAVLYRIATHSAARAPTPIMAIVFGMPEDWHIAGWVGRVVRRFRVFPGLSLEKVIPRIELS